MHRRLVRALVVARRRRRFGQIATAERMGCSQTLIARIELGVRRVDVIEFVALCRVLGINPLKLLALVLRYKEKIDRAAIIKATGGRP